MTGGATQLVDLGTFENASSILAGTDANAKSIGTTRIPGRIVSGTGNDLYISVGANTLTVNAKLLDNGSGSTNLIVNGMSTNNAAVLTLTNANSIGLTINANISTATPSITKAGLGYLGIGGQSANFSGAVNVNQGGLAVSSTVGASGAILGGQVILAGSTTLDARGNTGTFGWWPPAAPAA